MQPPEPAEPITRRRFLGSAAVTGSALLVPTTASAADGPEFGVVTRNLYVGVDLFRLLEARSLEDVRTIAGELFAEVETHPYEARAAAIAEEIAATAPAVVGLQEAVLIRTRSPSQFDGDHDPGATEVVVDLLAVLQSALADRGLPYEVATRAVTSDVEVPAKTDDGDADVRITDRVVLLVRTDVDVADAENGVFDASFEVPLDDAEVTIRCGYCRLDARIDGESVTAATAHLESIDAEVRHSQAVELAETLPSDRPVVYAGDSNSRPGQAAYDRLTEGFEDAHAALRPDGPGETCCQDADLRNGESALSVRIDHVLYRGALVPTGVERIGADPDDRIAVEHDGETVRMWPSDHVGIAASFDLPASETPTAMPTPTASPGNGSRETATTVESQRGMGVLAALVGTAVGVLSRAWKREDD